MREMSITIMKNDASAEADGTYKVRCTACGYEKRIVFSQYDRDEDENAATRKHMITAVRKHIAAKHKT
jgi:DNA-directed RNA polymerase subunit M/transcription elongation factor TFIIS